MNAKHPLFATSILVLSLLLLASCNKMKDADDVVDESQIIEISDKGITKKVEMAFKKDAVLNEFDLSVVTTDGEVKLTGTLDTQKQIDKAIKLAKEVIGTKEVVNELVLFPKINLPVG